MEDLTARFADLVQGPEDTLPLDLAALLIAAHAQRGLDLEVALAELDELAARCPGASFEAWRRHLFVDLGYSGNVEQYYDPANSFLNVVVRRRVGLPITLSVLAMEVGRRLGLHLEGVGMPGHFLVGDADAVIPTWVDPFAGGLVLDRAGCEERFHAVNGPGAAFRDDYLAPVGPRAILGRILANLKSIYATRGDIEALSWVFALRLAIPGTPASERRELAQVLGATGRFLEGAAELEAMADEHPGEAVALRSEAVALRARLN